MTGVSECSQQRGNLKDDGYNHFSIHFTEISLYNTAQFRVEWFQLIDLPNTEKLQIIVCIPYGFQDASRRQGSESPGA
ncbi:MULTISPECIES: hypothetical protein [Photorhabdus]|uniref:Uncharacterized protein n=1 Tax=Photorhabdus bodei TaxID=2029681 RepID=A0AAW6BDV8_9GAMM|nr:MULTISPECIES: hypothetical protein [Photorhabdus]MCC8466589.1 hypothetical protein [Photorhabdus bodei]MCT8352241.1 hypothetical protein [Photorhabdus kayaii]MDB6369280.1 hypothetical protein [Photorhabdus bodei]MDB6370728.1 hypothetical protein [Photorhabdus bodei]